jgi:hypothetical protein
MSVTKTAVQTESSEIQSKKSFMIKLKEKWGVKNAFQVIMILVVFSLTGSTVVYLKKGFFDFIGFDDHTSIWVKSAAYILFVLPAYQVLLLGYGTLLGQFDFFWRKEKKLLSLLARPFVKKSS